LLAAAVPRAVAALLMRREPFGDAYCYIESMIAYRAAIVSGSFSISHLYGFWLPLYQLFCSLISLVINEPVYIGRFVSVAAGTGVCVLVYLCSKILTGNQWLSLIAALAIALNPFHLQYSAAAMTDIPHAVMVMLCLYCLLTERWILAACAGATACLIRLDSWMLVALVPAIQLVRRRRLPILSSLILASAPAFWLFICWRATGSPLASFHAHDYYVIVRLAAHPELNSITLARTWMDANRLAYSANLAVFAGCFAAVWLLGRRWRQWREWIAPDGSPQVANLVTCLLFFFGYISFITLAYLTKQQSDIWNRYGLLSFAIGLPVLAYSVQEVFRGSAALAKAALLIAVVAGFAQFNTQAVDLARYIWTPDRSQTIASYLHKEYVANPSVRIFCDHPEVRISSGIPREQFYDSFQGTTPKDRKAFLEFLRANDIKFLVIPWESETSTARQLFPNLTKDPVAGFEDVIPVASDGSFDSLYRVRTDKLPPG
jgi:hypothetical protein